MRTAFVTFLIFLGLSCRTPFEETSKSVKNERPDIAADKLRDQMSRAPDDPKRVVLHDQLAAIELSRARESNTVLAYRRFLEEFPLGDESETARSLIEGLQFEAAKTAGTRDAWNAFLDEQPRGHHSTEARNALGSLEIDAALASSDVELSRRTLGRFPDHVKADALRRHEDDLAYALAVAAMSKGNDELDSYLAQHPDGTHRAAAEHERAAGEARTMEEAEDLPRARQLASRANATESNRAVLTVIELHRALRALDLDALRKIADAKSTEPSVLALHKTAADFLESLKKKPFDAKVQEAIEAARPGSGLPAHKAVVEAISKGDPIDRVAALRELAEWADPDDVRVILSALQSEYVAVRLEAVETLRSLASSLAPSVWKEIERTHEAEVLGKELSAATWRQLAALRDADGRTVEAAAGWRAATEADSTDLAARARTFRLAQASTDRLALGAAARELSKSAVNFAQERWTPRGTQDVAESSGTLLGMPGGQTTLRQICAAVDLGDDAAKALGELAQKAAPEEQQLLLLAKRDAETALDNIRLKRQELESSLQAQRAGFLPCGADPSAKVIEASRKLRVDAIGRLRDGGDGRVNYLLVGIQHSPSKEVRDAAFAAESALRIGKDY